VVVIDHPEPQVQQVVVPVPVFFPVATGRVGFRGQNFGRAVQPSEERFIPFQSGQPVAQPTIRQERAEPVYWGFGGKRRPDTWELPPDQTRDRPKEKR
jgi:hypothetical protein